MTTRGNFLHVLMIITWRHGCISWSKSLKSIVVVFKSFKTLVDKEYGKEIKILLTNRDGKFNSSASNRISKQLTTTYSPQ